MKKIHVNLQKNSYDILIGGGLLSSCGELISQAIKPCKVFIITDTNVAPLYLETVENALQNAGFTTAAHVFPAGEKSKTIDAVVTMVEDMANEQLCRTDCVVALGGGVVGDMAGFASAIYMRGIDFVQLSTSLLSDIDSSVGGKTGCDLENGKNLVGAFHQPKMVIIDTDTLDTLTEHFKSDGMGEMIKYGVFRSKSLFDRICELPETAAGEQNIYECVDIKREVVENDEFEHGERKLLNLGHTLGHAIEKYYNFEKYSHGEAITIGMVLMAKAAEKNGLCVSGVAKKIAECAEKFNLPTECDADIAELLKIAVSDKKRRGGKIDIILPKAIGDAFIYTIDVDKLPEFFDGIK